MLTNTFNKFLFFMIQRHITPIVFYFNLCIDNKLSILVDIIMFLKIRLYTITILILYINVMHPFTWRNDTLL